MDSMTPAPDILTGIFSPAAAQAALGIPSLVGGVVPASQLPIATSTQAGLVKAGTGVAVAGDGTLSSPTAAVDGMYAASPPSGPAVVADGVEAWLATTIASSTTNSLGIAGPTGYYAILAGTNILRRSTNYNGTPAAPPVNPDPLDVTSGGEFQPNHVGMAIHIPGIGLNTSLGKDVSIITKFIDARTVVIRDLAPNTITYAPLILLSGSVTSGTVLSCTISGGFTGSPQTVTYTCTGTDTLATAAANLAAAITANTTLSAALISAKTTGTGAGVGSSLYNAAGTLIQIGNYNAYALTVTTTGTTTPAATVTPMASVAQNGTTAQTGSLIGKTTVTWPCFQNADAGKGIYVSDGVNALAQGVSDVWGEATTGAVARILGVTNAYTAYCSMNTSINSGFGAYLNIGGTITPTDVITWTHYYDGLAASYTVQSGDTASSIATGIAAAITALAIATYSAVASGNTVFVSATSQGSIAEQSGFTCKNAAGTAAGTEVLQQGDADLAFRITGTVTATDTINIAFASASGNAGFPLTVTYTVQSGDTTTTIAAGVAAAINANATLAAAGVYAFWDSALGTNFVINCFCTGTTLPGGVTVTTTARNAGNTANGTETVLNVGTTFSVPSARTAQSGSKVVWGTDNIRNGAFQNISALLQTASPQVSTLYFSPGLACGFNFVPQATPIGNLVGQAALVGDNAKLYLFDSGAALSFKTVGPRLLGNPQPPMKGIIGRKHLTRTAAATSPVVAIIGKSVETPELFFGVASGSMSVSANAVLEASLVQAYPSKKLTFVNRAISGGHAVGLNSVFAGPEWYTNKYATWLSYCSSLPVPVDVAPGGTASPDLVYLGVDGSNDQNAFSARAYIAAINKILAFPQSGGLPPDLIVASCRPTDDESGVGDSQYWRTFGREFPTTFIRSFARRAGIGYYDLFGHGSVAMYGWDPFRLAFQSTPDLPSATLSKSAPYQLGGWRRRDYAVKMLLTASSFAAAMASIGQMTFQLSPKPDNVAVIDVAQPIITIGGTPRTGDVISLPIAGSFTGSPVTVSYTVQSSDTLTSIAAGLAAAINASTTLTTAGITATSWNAVVTLGNSTLAQFSSIAPSISPTGYTETVTVTPTNAAQYLRLAEVRSYGMYVSTPIAGAGTSTLTTSGQSQSIAAVTTSGGATELNLLGFSTLPTGLAVGQCLTVGCLGETDNAAPNVTLTGTVTTGDAVSLTITNPLVNGGTAVTVSYTTVGGDTLTTIAAALVTAINANSALNTALIKASSSGAVITFSASSSSSLNGNRNFINLNLTGAVTGAQTEAVNIAADTTYGSHLRTYVTRLRTPTFQQVQTADTQWIVPTNLSIPAYQDSQISWGGQMFHPLDAESGADVVIRDPTTNNVLYKGNVTGYNSQFQVTVSPPLPASLPSTALLFVGRLAAYNVMTSFDVNAGLYANFSNPAIEFGIKNSTLSLGVFLKTSSGAVFPFNYNSGRPLLALQVEKFGGPFVPYVTISGGAGGTGTIAVQGVQHWIDDIVPNKPVLTPWQMTGTGFNLGGSIVGGVYGGDSGKHPSSLQIAAVDIPLANTQEWV